MSVEMTTRVQTQWAETAEWRRIRTLSEQLLRTLNAPGTLSSTEASNQPGNSSSFVQNAITPVAESLGFRSERLGLFTDGVRGLRPDFYLRTRDTGILLEVERGKTTINDMDLPNFWRCHVCPSAHYLFLLVPKELRQNHEINPRREYMTVLRTLSEFFEPRILRTSVGCVCTDTESYRLLRKTPQ